MGDKVAALVSKEYETKDWEFDPFLLNFATGCKKHLAKFDESFDIRIPLILRGVGGGARKAIQHCWKTGRDFYIIDTGYFGNHKHKVYHRITKNNLQNNGPIVSRDSSRLSKINYKYVPFTPGNKILICPPSEKVMNIFHQPDPKTWTETVISELRKYTSRPIAVRLKPSRTERISTKTIEQALADDVHCLITYNSIAAAEALMNGKPAIALGPNAAQLLCNTSLSDIESLNTVDEYNMKKFLSHLSYCQFTEEEMLNGYAWNILQENL
jgi:hypothetical protein